MSAMASQITGRWIPVDDVIIVRRRWANIGPTAG